MGYYEDGEGVVVEEMVAEGDAGELGCVGDNEGEDCEDGEESDDDGHNLTNAANTARNIAVAGRAKNPEQRSRKGTKDCDDEQAFFPDKDFGSARST